VGMARLARSCPWSAATKSRTWSSVQVGSQGLCAFLAAVLCCWSCHVGGNACTGRYSTSVHQADHADTRTRAAWRTCRPTRQAERRGRLERRLRRCIRGRTHRRHWRRPHRCIRSRDRRICLAVSWATFAVWAWVVGYVCRALDGRSTGLSRRPKRRRRRRGRVRRGRQRRNVEPGAGRPQPAAAGLSLVGDLAFLVRAWWGRLGGRRCGRLLRVWARARQGHRILRHGIRETVHHQHCGHGREEGGVSRPAGLIARRHSRSAIRRRAGIGRDGRPEQASVAPR